MGASDDGTVRRFVAVARIDNAVAVWPMFSLSDANWEAPYSARFHVGASAPGG